MASAVAKFALALVASSAMSLYGVAHGAAPASVLPAKPHPSPVRSALPSPISRPSPVASLAPAKEPARAAPATAPPIAARAKPDGTIAFALLAALAAASVALLVLLALRAVSARRSRAAPGPAPLAGPQPGALTKHRYSPPMHVADATTDEA